METDPAPPFHSSTTLPLLCSRRKTCCAKPAARNPFPPVPPGYLRLDLDGDIVRATRTDGQIAPTHTGFATTPTWSIWHPPRCSGAGQPPSAKAPPGPPTPPSAKPKPPSSS